MIIQLKNDISPEQKAQIMDKLSLLNIDSKLITTQIREYIVGIAKKEFDLRCIGSMKGISDIHRVSDQYKMVSGKWKLNPTIINLGDGVKIGDGDLASWQALAP